MDMRQLPKYRSHKEVWALKIKSVEYQTVPGEDYDGTKTLSFYDEGYAPIAVDADYVKKHDPQPEGYYVVYEDGYKSWSPAEAFEAGYVRI